MHQTDILWFGKLVLMHANTRNKFRNQCEQKYCCGRHSIKDAAVAVRLVAIYVHMWDTKSFFRRVAKNDQD